MATSILVVGAGPTGLSLALQALNHGGRVRIVERRPHAIRPSRALIVHPRTLEVLRPLGVVEDVLARADTAPAANLKLGRRWTPVQIGELDLRDTAFPHLTLVRQMDIESVLIAALAEKGVEVERDTEVTCAESCSAGARAVIQSPRGTELAEFDAVVGSDGPHSTVRRCAGIAWSGGSYKDEVVLADVELDTALDRDAAHVLVGRQGLLLIFPLGERATWRVLTTRPAGPDTVPFGQPGPPVSVGVLQALMDEAGLEASISSMAWSARYRLQHRLAARFRVGQLFLTGDAAHAYSPATGQGMNMGIQDALNLGWKLAFATSATDRNALLNSYEIERRPIVRRALVLTHLAFWAEASRGLLPSLIRGVAGPLVAPLVPFLARRRRLFGESLGMASQMRTAYRDSPISIEGRPELAGTPRTGQRLPDSTVTTEARDLRLHALIAKPGVHVLLQRDADPIERGYFGPQITIHRLTSTAGVGLIAVRPDGYVGFRCGVADPGQLRSWLAEVGALA
jgi:2-polyprenyl-6-methoxyphenol hydroxylase-like FAD-dependent oxidoreductase